jgi:hypothetical protein
MDWTSILPTASPVVEAIWLCIVVPAVTFGIVIWLLRRIGWQDNDEDL